MGDHAQDCINESIDFEFGYADDYYGLSQDECYEKYGEVSQRHTPHRLFTHNWLETDISQNGGGWDLDEFLCEGIGKQVSDVVNNTTKIRLSTAVQTPNTVPDFIKGDYGKLSDRQIEVHVCRIDKSNLTHQELLALAEHSKKYIVKWNMMVGMVKTVLAGGVLSSKQKAWLSTNITESVEDFPRLCQDINYRNRIVAMRDHIVRSAAYK